MNNFWKGVITIAVIAIAAMIIIPKMIGTSPDNEAGTVSTGTGSSLETIEKTIKNGKPTLLLLRSET